MKRKVSKIGQSTLMVSLPHQWVKEHNLKKGDEVEVEVSAEVLEIRSANSIIPQEKKECSLSFEYTYPKMVRAFLKSLYRTGYDRIVLCNVEPKTREEIRFIVGNYLLGFEVVEETEEKVVIESLTEPTEDKSSVLLRKVFFILKEALGILIEDMKQEKLTRKEIMYDLMLQSDRFCNFFSRTLYKQRQLNPFAWAMVQQLLLTEHSIYYCYHVLEKSSYRRFSKEVFSYLADIRKILLSLEIFYYQSDFSDVEKITELKDELLYRKISVLQKTKEGIFVSPYLFDIVKTLHSARIPLLGLHVQSLEKKTCEKRCNS